MVPKHQSDFRSSKIQQSVVVVVVVVVVAVVVVEDLLLAYLGNSSCGIS